MASQIGTYGEKTLHRDLKWQIEPTGACHEMPVGKYIADILDENGIIEIQTQSFHRIRAKLAAFLPEHKVTLVYPVAREKQIIMIDTDGGEIIRTRKSPRRGSFRDVFREIYQIKTLLTHSNLTLRIILLDVSERRAVSERRRKRYVKIDTEITSLREELLIRGRDDYLQLIPDALDGQFTSADFAKAAGMNPRNAGIALNVLNHVGAVVRSGRRGRYYVYSRYYDEVNVGQGPLY